MIEWMMHSGVPAWIVYLGAGLGLFYLIATGSVVVARAGYHPIFALLVLVPWVNIAGVWILAFLRWPGVDGPSDADGGADGAGRKPTRSG